MKVESYFFIFFAVFVAISDAIYWWTSYDPSGTVALAIAGFFGIFIGSFLAFTARRTEPRPEDTPDAEIADGAGEIGFFSPHSWWPLALGIAPIIFATGFLFGWWICIIAGAWFIVAISGMLYEYYLPSGPAGS